MEPQEKKAIPRRIAAGLGVPLWVAFVLLGLAVLAVIFLARKLARAVGGGVGSLIKPGGAEARVVRAEARVVRAESQAAVREAKAERVEKRVARKDARQAVRLARRERKACIKAARRLRVRGGQRRNARRACHTAFQNQVAQIRAGLRSGEYEGELGAEANVAESSDE